MDKPQQKVSAAGKNMLSFALSSAVSHNRRNLAQGAKNKNPERRTVAEKEALETVQGAKDVRSDKVWKEQEPKTTSVSVWQQCVDKSEESWNLYRLKKIAIQEREQRSDIWYQCVDKSDKSWRAYVFQKQNIC